MSPPEQPVTQEKLFTARGIYNRETEGGRTFIAKAVKLWNSLPDKLKDCPNIKSFMRAYTSHFPAMNADLDHFTVN